MKTWQIIVLVYMLVMSIAGFISMGVDKRRAAKGKWRVSEAALFVIALIGGALGSVIGMRVFRHKTKHWYFVVFMPLIMIIQIALIVFLFIKL